MAVTLGALSLFLEANTAKFTANLKKAEDAVERMTASFARAGAAIGNAGLAISAGMLKATSDASEFGRTMVQVGSRAGASIGDMNKMKAAALGVAEGTKFTAREVGDAMIFMAQAGQKPAEIMENIKPVADLAAAGMLGMGRAADIVTNIMAGFGLKGGDALIEANDKLITVATNSNVSIENLGQSMKFVSPLASALQLELGDVASALGVMGDSALQGGMGGRNLASALTQLIKPNDTAKRAFERFSVSLRDSKGKLLPFQELLKNLAPIMSDATLAAEVFGTQGFRAMQTLSAQAPKLGELNAMMEETMGITRRIAQAEMNTFAGQVDQLKSAFSSLLIELGERAMPTMKLIVDGLRNMMRAWKGLDEALKQQIVGYTTLGGVAAGALRIIAPIVASIATNMWNVTKATTAFSLKLLPIAVIVGGIVAGIGALNMVLKTMGTSIIDSFKAALTFVSKALQWLASSFLASVRFMITGALKAFGPLLKLMGESPEKMLDQFDEFANNVKLTFKGMPETTADAFAKMGKAAKDGLTESLAEGVNVIKDMFGELGVDLEKQLGKGLGVLDQIQSKVGEVVKAATGAKGGGPTEGFELPAGKRVSSTAFGGGGSFMRGPSVEGIKKSMERGVKFIGDGLRASAPIVAGTVVESMGKLGGTIQAAAQGMAMGGPIGAAVAAIMDILSHADNFKVIISIFNEAFSVLVQALNPVLEPIIRVARLFGVLVKVVATVLGPMLKAFIDAYLTIWFPVMKAAAWVVAQVAIGIGKVWNAIVGAIADVLDAIPGLGDEANALRKRKMDIQSLNRSLKEIGELELDSAVLLGVNNQFKELNSTMRETNRQMTNIPTGYKVALRTFQATAARGAPVEDLGGGSMRDQMAQSTAPVNVGTVNVVTDDPQEFLRELEKEAAIQRDRATGLSQKTTGQFMTFEGASGR